MGRTKANTTKAFGLKKRSKARGRQGGRKLESARVSSVPELAEPMPSTSTSVQADVFTSTVMDERNSSSFRKQDYFRQESAADSSSFSASEYRIISIDCLETLVKSLACPKCGELNVELKEVQKGMKSIFKTYCSGCDEVICTSRNSTYSARNKTSKLNLLTVASARNNGIGYSKLTNLLSGMNLPVFHLKTYQLLSKTVHNAAAVALEEHFTAVAEIIKTEYKSYEQTGDIVDIAVSFDGTWHKRGHTSLFGVGAVIDLLTGLVVDVAVMSKYCHGCSLATTNPERYRLHQCQINYDGSSGAMEVEIALLLFQRSVSNYRLRYTTMLSDGDCKSYTKLKESNIYGEGHEIIKEECINHVSKRMGSALRKLKESSKQSGMSMGGKGRLTNEKVELIQNYYGKALKDNAPDIEKMRNAVYASLFHMVSTDNEPHHTFCPTGSQSWCHYNRAIENPAMKRQHKPTLPKDIGEALLPIYKRLTATELLERCTKNKTQNTNESLHSIIWQKCPKANFASLSSVTTAASLAVLQYNKGPKGFYDVLSKLHIEVGKHQEEIASRNLKRRLDDSARFSTTTWKVERKGKKLKRLKAKDKQEETMYEAGAF